MIVRNEEQNLSRCLESVKGTVDDILIVDTGSTDRTMDIARRFGAQIVEYSWKNDFADARNEGLRQVHDGWIFHLDADEKLTYESAAAVKRVIERTTADALMVNIRNFQTGQDLVKWLDDPQIRLFRGDRSYRYEQSVHEQIGKSITRSGGRIDNTGLVIEHFGYTEEPAKKAQRNLPLLLAALDENPDDAYLHFKMGETLKAMNRFEEARLAFEKVFDCHFKSLAPEIIDTLYLRLGQIELARDRYPEVLRYCLEALKINPGNVIAMYVLSIALVYLGELEKAEGYLNRILSADRQAIISRSDIQKLLSVCSALKSREKVI